MTSSLSFVSHTCILGIARRVRPLFSLSLLAAHGAIGETRQPSRTRDQTAFAGNLAEHFGTNGAPR